MNDATQRLGNWGAKTAIVLGSGLGGIVKDDPNTIPYTEFSEIPKPSVPGHDGRFVLSELAGTKVIFAQGRVHLYEDLSARDVTACVRILSAAGARKIVFTNAAGSANSSFAPGDWMLISDHINLTGTTPLLGGPNFVDMTAVYSERMRNCFKAAAAQSGVKLREGVYAGLVGPQYETPAEIRMMQNLGADAVGMSTVLEAMQARALEMEVAGFSCLTNFAAGISGMKITHGEVLETGKCAADNFAKLLAAALPAL